MRFAKVVAILVVVGSAVSLVSGHAFAQEGESPQPPPPPRPTPRPPPPPPAPAASPPASASPEPEKESTQSDHDKYVGHLAFGYFGVSQLPIAQPAGAGNAPGVTTLNAPVIGVRYWFSQRFGIDGGIGIGISTGSQATVVNGGASTSTNQPSAFGFAAHVGVPIALARASHYTFEIVPETLIGVTSGSISTPMQADQALTGLRFDLGGRVGAEIHFGFIGIPQLALEGSVGLYYRHQAYKWSQGNNSGSVDTNAFATSVQSDPWAIFVNNVSALYYF